MRSLYLDHVLIAVRDLDRTAETFRDRLGFSVTPEGTHPGRGSHNRLVVFGPEYLELISVRDPSQKLFRPNIVPFLEGREGLFVFAMGTDDVDGWYPELVRRGVAVREPVDGSRLTTAGAPSYSWRQAEIAPGDIPGSQTFLIQQHQTVAERYTEPPEPTRHANGVKGIHHLALAVYDAQEAADRWRRAFGLEAQPPEDLRSQGTRRVRLDLGNCYVDLLAPLGPGPLSDFLHRNGQAPYRLGLEVRDLSEAVHRLGRRGVPTGSVTDAADGPSVTVAPEHAHGVPIVLIESA